jgi:hypothetical protein
MSLVQRTINQCDVCGHEWIPRGSSERCGNRKCRSMKWNSGGHGIAAGASAFQADDVGSTPTVRSKPDMDALRDICVGRITPVVEPMDVVWELCPRTGFNEVDGETYRCSLEKGHRGPCRPGERV